MNNTAQQSSELYAELRENLYEVPAGTGQRFLNYIIDIIFFYLLVVFFGVIAGLTGLISGNEESDSLFNNPILEYLFGYMIYIFYYTLFETLAKGRTIGKMITKTRAVTLQGETISFQQALNRSLIRIIPFDALSAFGGNPWHDRWANTKVVKDNN